MAERFANLKAIEPTNVLPSYLERVPEPGHGEGQWGHRGVAIGTNKPGKQDLSPENVAKWRELGREAAEGFMEGEILFVHSTNVVAAQFFPETNQMMIEYKKGAAYLYSNISPAEAWDFLQAMSKGSWTWSALRVRGKGNAKKFKKPFVKLR